jgi:mRNA-degrading endonuclease toxin of MazEF toxin-antitoxin module
MMRGTVVWVDLSDATPPEMGKRRPVLIISNSTHNHALESVMAVPLSPRAPEILPLRIRVQVPGLKPASFAIIPGIRQLKKSRILGTVGRLKESELNSVEQAIREYLSD